MIRATRPRGATVRLEDLREACLVEVTAQRRRDCACPCFRAHSRGVCRIWIWPPETYYLALVGPGQRARGIPVCQSCVEALQAAGHLHRVANSEALAIASALSLTSRP